MDERADRSRRTVLPAGRRCLRRFCESSRGDEAAARHSRIPLVHHRRPEAPGHFSGGQPGFYAMAGATSRPTSPDIKELAIPPGGLAISIEEAKSPQDQMNLRSLVLLNPRPPENAWRSARVPVLTLKPRDSLGLTPSSSSMRLVKLPGLLSPRSGRANRLWGLSGSRAVCFRPRARRMSSHGHVTHSPARIAKEYK